MTQYIEVSGALYEAAPDDSVHGCEGCAFEHDNVGCGLANGKVDCTPFIWLAKGSLKDHLARSCGACAHGFKAMNEDPCNKCVGDPDVPKGYKPMFTPSQVPKAPGPVTRQLQARENLNDTPPVRDPEVVAAVSEAMAISQATGQYDSAVKDSNPKTAVGDKKVPLALLSPIAEAHWSLAQFAGMCKYQAWNWRIAGVRTSTYVSAMRRHLAAWQSGEQYDPTDGTHHLGNIMACAAILLDAEAAGKLTDDRPPSVDVRPTYAFVEAQMAVLKERYAHIEQKPFTIADTAR